MEDSTHSEQKPTKLLSELPKAIDEKVHEVLKLITWDQLPAWQQDNHFIHGGYRPASGSYLGSFQSLAYLHNESVNVCSHLIGAIIAILAGGSLFSAIGKRYPLADRDDLWVISCYFMGAVACLGMSATYHLISNHSEAVAKFGNKLDYLGIVALIWGSFVPTVYYGFREDIHLMKLYWGMVRDLPSFPKTVQPDNHFRLPP